MELVLALPAGEVILEGPASADQLRALKIDPGLKSFRPPERQKKALIEIAQLPEGRVMIARRADLLVGYVAFHPPEPFERWGNPRTPGVLELGAVEVSSEWRKGGLARRLIQLAFEDGALEDYIVLATEYYWHWDLKGTGLDPWQYRHVMEKVMGSAGLLPRLTDDPDIACHPANMLVVRVGSRVGPELQEAFERMLFREE